jgi:hypothetical protein
VRPGSQPAACFESIDAGSDKILAERGVKKDRIIASVAGTTVEEGQGIVIHYRGVTALQGVQVGLDLLRGVPVGLDEDAMGGAARKRFQA